MSDGLVSAERAYHREIGHPEIDLQGALRMNTQYYGEMFDFYRTLTNPEEKLEVRQELLYLEMQARFLTQLNNPEESA